jgi:hypothetical protein
MKLENYEVQSGDKWEPVKGTTVGMKAGWLSWTDGDSNGLARPGTWRPQTRMLKAPGQSGHSVITRQDIERHRQTH